MSNKDGFVCITRLPCELREGQGKGVYLRCQNNVESVSPTGGARSSMADAGETEKDLIAICFHLLSVLLPFCLKPALSTDVSTQSSPGPHKTGRDVLLAHFKDGTTGASERQSPRSHSYSLEEENNYQAEKGRAKAQEMWEADTHLLVLGTFTFPSVSGR